MGWTEREIASSINIRWHTRIYHYMRLGAKRIRDAKLTPGHREALSARFYLVLRCGEPV